MKSACFYSSFLNQLLTIQDQFSLIVSNKIQYIDIKGFYNLHFQVWYNEFTGEANIIFIFQNKKFYFSEIINYLAEVYKVDVSSLNKCTVNANLTEKIVFNIGFVLDQLQIFLELDPSFFESIENHRKLKLEQEISKEFFNDSQNAWQQKDYKQFLKIYSEYKKLNSNLDSILTKTQKLQLKYAENHLK